MIKFNPTYRTKHELKSHHNHSHHPRLRNADRTRILRLLHPLPSRCSPLPVQVLHLFPLLHGAHRCCVTRFFASSCFQERPAWKEGRISSIQRLADWWSAVHGKIILEKTMPEYLRACDQTRTSNLNTEQRPEARENDFGKKPRETRKEKLLAIGRHPSLLKQLTGPRGVPVHLTHMGRQLQV